MKSRDKPVTFRLTSKNKKYLNVLGMFDFRTGRPIGKGLGFSRFVNECITDRLELRMNGVEATADELKAAFLKSEITRNSIMISKYEKKIKRLREEYVLITQQLIERRS